MVKNILSIAITVLLLLSAGLFEHFYLKKEFNEFNEVLVELYKKTEDRTALKEDGEAAQAIWEKKKKTLHIVIPHTSIVYVDYWLSEATGLIGEGKYELALPKLGVLRTIIEALPATYEPSLENIL
ncbi:MAG: DUF4363 family protein [Clostridia bacterium]|nr:DUF4363 family protein [Clostridia bacterium]